MDRIFCILIGAMIRQMDQSQINAMRDDISSLKQRAHDSEDDGEELLQRLMAIDQAEKVLTDALR